MGSTMTDKTAPITRYCFRSEGMSDPPEQFESPTGDLVDYWDHLQIEKELLARIESLEAQLSARQAVSDVAGPTKDRLLNALERAAAAETALRRLVDECENDMVPGWEDRMLDCIAVANDLLAAPPPPEREPLSETEVRGLLESAGYWPGEDAQRADFINGLRYCEMAHGIGATNDNP